MKKTIILVLILCTAIFEWSCESFDCELIDDMPTYDDIVQASEVEYANVILDPQTLNVDTLVDGQVLVINSQAKYDDLKVANGNCTVCSFPDIDFNDKTLFGVFYYIDCTAIGNAKVTTTNTGYLHHTKSVDSNQCLFLTCLNYSLGWVTVPKIDSTTTIETVYGKSFYRCNC
jgi:hypothetical protein